MFNRFCSGGSGGLPLLQRETRYMKTLVNKNNPQMRITAPAIDIDCLEDYYRIPGVALLSNKVWTLVEEESKYTEVWVEGRTIFEQREEYVENRNDGFEAGKEWAFKQFSDILGKWEEHAILGMKVGASAYHQGKIALICDLRDWIKEQTKKQ